jgi:hypothetical protein
MIDFWDIEFDSDNEFLDDDFIEGLIKLGFTQKTKFIYVKEIVNHFGNVISDGLLIDLQSKKIHYHPEPNCTVNYELTEPDITKVDFFIRNNII